MIASPSPAIATRSGSSPLAWLQEAARRQRALTLFAVVMALLLVPTFIAMGLDDRTVRGVNVWVKPAKFMVSLAVFSITAAWFFGLVDPAWRRARGLRWMVAAIIALGSFEIAYIVLQSARGLASHYNFSSTFHIVMYQAMGAAAMALTATQLVLAWFIARHPAAGLHPAWRAAVIAGLVLTFLLGAGAGGVLGGMQPPAGPGLPAFGWKSMGDLRPAHFLGMHAQQLLPLAGVLLARYAPASGRGAVIAVAVVYAVLWAALLAMGLNGAVPTPIPGMGR